jgi:hypothetical protein
MQVSAADTSVPMPVKTALNEAPPSEWSFHFTPYLWAAALKGDVALGPLAPPVHIDAGFIDILNHLRMTFMGTFEVRIDKIGFISDLSYLAVKVSGTGPLGFVNGELNDKTFFGTFAGAYRLIDQGTAWVDAIGGARTWWREDVLDITGPGGAISASRSRAWVDPIVGLRVQSYLNSKFYVQVYGDIGGFGVAAKSDWQAVGLLGYQYDASKSFFAGYRYLAVDYRADGYIFDVKLSGPVFGASFKF